MYFTNAYANQLAYLLGFSFLCLFHILGLSALNWFMTLEEFFCVGLEANLTG